MNLGLDMSEPEGMQLAYEDVRVLERPRVLVRDVAAMLNAQGGTIWVGVREEGGFPVEFQGVPDAPAQRRRVEDALADLLEPAWSGELGQVDVVTIGGKTLLVITCHASADGRPFALVGAGGREFVTRVGAHVRELSRDELTRAFASATPMVAPAEFALQVIEEFRGRVMDRRRFADRFWMLATPDEPLRLPFDDDPFRAELLELLAIPERSGNQRGFTVVQRVLPPRVGAEAAWVGDPDDVRWSLGFDARGTLRFHVPLDVPAFNTPLRSRETRLWPYAFCQLPVSFLRLLDALYELGRIPDATALRLDVGLAGARGWTLGPASPNTIRHRVDARALEQDEIVWTDPVRFARADLREHDRVAWRAVTRLYRAFGHQADDLPREWDRETKRLDLPS